MSRHHSDQENEECNPDKSQVHQTGNRQQREREGKHDLQHNVGVPEKLQPATSNTRKVPTCQSLQSPTTLKSKRRPVELWSWCPLVLGSVARLFWGWSPLREVPTPLSQHSHDAAGTSTSAVRLAIPGTLPSSARDGGSRSLEMLFSVQHHDPRSHGLEMLFSAVVALIPSRAVFHCEHAARARLRELLGRTSLKDTL